MKTTVKFIKETSDKGFYNPFSGRLKSVRFVAVNQKGEKGYLPDSEKPYTPIGGIKALKEVLGILIFK